MFCTNCGKQIPDDSAFCPECGAKIGGAPKKPSAGGSFDINAVLDMFKADPLKIVSFAGAFILLISLFLPWVTVKFFGTVSANLFQMRGIDVLAGILYIIAALFFMAWDIIDFVPVVKPIKDKIVKIPFIELIISGVLTFLVFLSMILKGGAGSIGSIGFGAVLALLACLAILAPRVLAVVNKKN